MKNIINKAWFQILVLGILIGALLIMLDSKFAFFQNQGNNKPDVYNGAIRTPTSDMDFTEISFSETSFNFGEAIEGDTVMHSFTIKNTGNEPLLIFKTKGSCDCIKAYYDDKPILPGAAGKINVYFKTKGRKGHQVRTVNVSTNTDPAENTLTLTGTVK